MIQITNLYCLYNLGKLSYSPKLLLVGEGRNPNKSFEGFGKMSLIGEAKLISKLGQFCLLTYLRFCLEYLLHQYIVDRRHPESGFEVFCEGELILVDKLGHHVQADLFFNVMVYV